MKLQRGSQSIVSSLRAGSNLIVLPLDPTSQKGEGNLAEGGSIQSVVVQKDGETIPAPIPHVPDEWPVVEQPAVLIEELVAKPAFEPPVPVSTEEAILYARAPLIALRLSQRPSKPLGT